MSSLPPRNLAAHILLVVTLSSVPALAQAGGEAGRGVNMNFSGAPLTEVMEMVADLTGKKFLYQGGRGGSPGISNQEVYFDSEALIPLDKVYPVFQSIMQMHGFALIEVGDDGGRIVKVVSMQRAQIQATEHIGVARLEAIKTQERFVCITYALQNIGDGLRVQQQLRTIAPGSADGLMILGIQNVPVISITGFAPTVYRIYQMVKAIDGAVEPRLVVVIPLEHAIAQDLAELLRRVQANPSSVGRVGLTVEVESRTNSLLLGGTEADIAIARATIRTLDVPARGGHGTDADGVATLLAALESEDGEQLVKALRDLAAARQAVADALTRARESGSDLDLDVRQLLELLEKKGK